MARIRHNGRMKESLLHELSRKSEIFFVRAERLGDMQVVRHLRKLYKRLSFDAVLDAGGNSGQYGRLVRKSGYLD